MARLFVDMDGVLADFDRGYGERFGKRPSKADDNVDWGLVERTEGFYRDLPPMPDFEQLWAGLEHLSPTVLTGVPWSVPEALENKRAWVTKHIGPDVPMIGCKSRDKCLHGQPGDVLIDDWEKYMDRWKDMGGVWITHTSAAESLRQLFEVPWVVPVTATIKGGRIATLWGIRRLFGTIHGDTLGRYPDGHEVHTSPVKKGRQGDRFVRTKNSLYRVEWADDAKAE